MPSVFRSEEIQLHNLVLQNEVAYECINELGELGLVQFCDLNEDTNAYQRRFVAEVRRCDHLERILVHFKKELDDRNTDHRFPIKVKDLDEKTPAPRTNELSDLENTLDQISVDLTEVSRNDSQLKKTRAELSEVKIVLRQFENLLETEINPHVVAVSSENYDVQPHLASALETNLDFVAGVILREKVQAFERLIWRACRGNVFLHQMSIDKLIFDPAQGVEVAKNVVVVAFQGGGLREKINRICSAFHVNTYPCPRGREERRNMAIGVMTRLDDLERVIQETSRHRDRVLESVAAKWPEWSVKVHKAKAIYNMMNQLKDDITSKCLLAEIWLPSADIEIIDAALQRAQLRSGSEVAPILHSVSTKATTPTYFKLNKFTQAFQNIVNAYGIPRYGEVNPALFAIITFPFLFAVMFGDCGHGFIMFLTALWMVVYERRLLTVKGGSIWDMFFGGRYVILLMGAFSIYTGLVYNDCFSVSLNIFGSSWRPSSIPSNYLQRNEEILLTGDKNHSQFTGNPYPFGIDPAWQTSINKITFLNSIKMKMSILLGTMQMFFGLALSLVNLIHAGNFFDIFAKFIPEVLFLGCIFGNLCVLFFYKWIYFTPEMSQAPQNLLVGLINMFMLKYDYKAKKLSDRPLYKGQDVVQIFLLVICVICIPWMLLVKPLKRFLDERKRSRGSGYDRLQGHNSEDSLENSGESSRSSESSGSEEEESFSDFVVYQVIHTIEYCLGTISNTASYLRLWALSLAHAELSEVLWTMVFRMGLSSSSMVGSILMFFVFAIWACLTIGIMLLMEGLSAFLHALRLHWVEFQCKFYHGDGELFMPFSFREILKEDEEG